MIGDYDPLEGETLRILDEQGEVVEPGLEPDLSDGELLEMYRAMRLTRAADEKALKLQRTGRMGTYASSDGHEAIQVGSAAAMREEDWMFPYFRDLGAWLTRGFPLWQFYHYWKGNERGMQVPEGQNDFTVSIPVGSQIPHAVGAAWAAKKKGDDLAALTFFGDGATSGGDFHEGLNFAGVFETPTVFVCHNNQYAISTPFERQSGSETVAQKAVSYGFPGIRVDGMDPLAMYAVTREALGKAREEYEPTLIEGFTYRFGDHTTSDDASRYRTEEEVEEWRARDPVARFRRYLEGKGLWSDGEEGELEAELKEEVDEAVDRAEEEPSLEPDEVFEHMFAEVPSNLEKQREELREFLEWKESEGGD